MPENIKKDLCKQSTIGQKIFQSFVKEWIQERKTNFWNPMKKQSFSLGRQKGKSQTWGRQQLRGAARRQEPVCKNDASLQESTGY